VNVSGKHVVVTGAANGIRLALARRIHQAGASSGDLDGARRYKPRCSTPPGRARRRLAADIGTEQATSTSSARRRVDPIDLFFANAGTAIGAGLDTKRSRARVRRQRHATDGRQAPRARVARRSGHFCSTASAAGILTRIAAAPYSLTKHAAVAFAEWLAITYGDQGIRVSCLCPQGVNTDMLRAVEQAGGGRAGTIERASGVLEPADVRTLTRRHRSRTFLIAAPRVLTYWAQVSIPTAEAGM
jgi:NAD(P)-dependent dehydrogenase (short-subunit alcohol dehydrogenase family)